MKYGHFDDEHREYVITRPDTPLPWLNYIGQEDFFGLVTNTAGGYSFWKDAKLRRLTRYRYNNIPMDVGGRYLYVRDGDCVWNPGWKPVKTPLDRYECRLGNGDRALAYYLAICPSTKEDIADVYRCEPYVYAQMIAGKEAATPGEAKNSWLTGTAAWTFLAVSQGILGIVPDYDGLRIEPCIPSGWARFDVTRVFRGATYRITVENPRHVCRGVAELIVDSRPVPGTLVLSAAAGETRHVRGVMG